jgi:hypothetical protein
LPALVSGGLLLMFGIQMILPPAPVPESISGVAPRNLRLPQLPVAASTKATLMTPLFTPTRIFDADIATAAAAESADNSLQLIGVRSVRGSKRAFLKPSNGTVESVGLGGRVKGWLLTALTQDSARLSKDGQTITLQAGIEQSAASPATVPEKTSEEETQ